jgi:MFS family permease
MRGFWTKLGLCLLMFLATIFNYLNRQTLSILAPTLQPQMQMGNEALGWLFAGFYYSYTLFQFAVGPVLDRFNLRWCFALAVFAWSTVSGMTGLATGFAGLLVFRLLLGVMESANWPASLRIVARVFPPKERTLASGIFTSGTSVAALIAPGLILAILATSGWRWAFVAGALWDFSGYPCGFSILAALNSPQFGPLAPQNGRKRKDREAFTASLRVVDSSGGCWLSQSW